MRFDEQARGERRRQAGVAIESAAAAGLKPWREIVTPHNDVASGRYQQAEFAADLWQVHLGEGDGRVPGPGRVLSANLPDGEPEGPGGRCHPSPRGSRWRSRGAVADQLRGRQDPLHACPCITCSPRPRRVSWLGSTPCCRRLGRRGSGGPAAWCLSATRSHPEIR